MNQERLRLFDRADTWRDFANHPANALPSVIFGGISTIAGIGAVIQDRFTYPIDSIARIHQYPHELKLWLGPLEFSTFTVGTLAFGLLTLLTFQGLPRLRAYALEKRADRLPL